MTSRTDYCGRLGRDDIGRTVTVCGWVSKRREHGEHLAFVDLRGRTGIVQGVVDHAHEIRNEYVLAITGVVRPTASRSLRRFGPRDQLRLAGS